MPKSAIKSTVASPSCYNMQELQKELKLLSQSSLRALLEDRNIPRFKIPTDRRSWFVDAKYVTDELRAAARPGKPLKKKGPQHLPMTFDRQAWIRQEVAAAAQAQGYTPTPYDSNNLDERYRHHMERQAHTSKKWRRDHPEEYKQYQANYRAAHSVKSSA